jgi:hypothetical protein
MLYAILLEIVFPLVLLAAVFWCGVWFGVFLSERGVARVAWPRRLRRPAPVAEPPLFYSPPLACHCEAFPYPHVPQAKCDLIFRAVELPISGTSGLSAQAPAGGAGSPREQNPD